MNVILQLETLNELHAFIYWKKYVCMKRISNIYCFKKYVKGKYSGIAYCNFFD